MKQLELFKNNSIGVLTAIRLKVRAFFKAIYKWNKRRVFLKKKEWLDLARGEIMEQFEPFIMKVYNDSITKYQENIEQTEETKKTAEDIKRFLEIELKSYIMSKIN